MSVARPSSRAGARSCWSRTPAAPEAIADGARSRPSGSSRPGIARPRPRRRGARARRCPASRSSPGAGRRRGLRAGDRPRRRRHAPARRRARARHRRRAARRQPRPRRLPRRGRAGGPRRRSSTGVVARDYAVEERMTLDVACSATAREHVPRRGRSTRPASRRRPRERHDRARRRGRRPSAVALGLRRRRVRDPDRLDRVRVLGRRSGRLARGPGAAHGADQRARAVRPAAGRRADVGARGRAGDRTRRRRRAVVRRPAHGRRAPGDRVEVRRGAEPVRLARLQTTRRSPTGWSRKFDLPVDGWRGPGAAAP